MFWKFDFDRFLEKDKEFEEYSLKDASARSDHWATFPFRTRKYKDRILSMMDNSIRNKDSDELSISLSLAWHDGMDEDFIPRIKGIVLAEWHECHEDIVSILEEIADDDFISDLYVIATTPNKFRKYDGELESSLRKCVHTLMAIDTEESRKKIKLLVDSGNENVKSALENYK